MLRGTPVVVVRVGAYLLLLFVFVAGMTEIPREDERTGETERRREGSEEGGEDGNESYDFIVLNGPLSDNHCHHHVYHITVITYLLMMAARQGSCLGG